MIPAPPPSVVILIGLQAGFFRSDPLRQYRRGIVNATNRLLRGARAFAWPVVWCVQHGACLPRGGVELLDGLDRRDEDDGMIKPRLSPFHATALDSLLPRPGAARIVVGGVQTHADVRAAVVDAWQRGHAVALAVDACASADPEHESITLRYLHDEKIAQVMTIAALAAGWDCR